MTFAKKINVVLVDDHTLFRKGMVELVNNFENLGSQQWQGVYKKSPNAFSSRYRSFGYGNARDGWL